MGYPEGLTEIYKDDGEFKKIVKFYSSCHRGIFLVPVSCHNGRREPHCGENVMIFIFIFMSLIIVHFGVIEPYVLLVGYLHALCVTPIHES